MTIPRPSLAAELGVLDRTDSIDLDALVAKVIADHPSETQRFRDGEQRLIGFFVGACMRASQGRADARALQQVLRQHLT